MTSRSIALTRARVADALTGSRFLLAFVVIPVVDAGAWRTAAVVVAAAVEALDEAWFSGTISVGHLVVLVVYVVVVGLLAIRMFRWD